MTVAEGQPGAHVSESALLDYLDAQAGDQDRQSVYTHLEQCPECEGRRQSLANLVDNLGAELLHDAPADVVTRAIRLFPVREPLLERVRQRLVGLLQFDSALQPLAPGLRSDQSGGRQRVYVAGEYIVDLREAPSRGGWTVTGQILGEQPLVALSLLATTKTVTGKVVATGEFSFPPIGAGEYALTIELGSLDLVIEAIRIGL